MTKLDLARKLAFKLFSGAGIPYIPGMDFLRLREDQLTMGYGNGGTGKTSIAVYESTVHTVQELRKIPDAVNLINDGVIKFVVIDADSSYDKDRHQQIAEAHGVDFELVDKAMMVKRVRDQVHLNTVILGPRKKRKRGGEEGEEEEEPVESTSIGEGIEKEFREMGAYPFLVAIDAHTVFYRNAVAGAPKEYRGGTIARYQTSLEKHLMLLRWFSVDYRIPTFVTSYPKSELFYAMLPVRIAKVEKEIKQARQEGRNADVVRLMDELQRLKDETRVPYIGGRPYQHWPKVIFELRAPEETSPRRVLKLIKHRSHGYARTEFRLTQKGVEV